jgi:hypothetical protein
MKKLFNLVVVVSGLALMSPAMACDKEDGAHVALANQNEKVAQAPKKDAGKFTAVAAVTAKTKTTNPRYIAPFE